MIEQETYCVEEKQVEPTSQVTVLVSVNVVWRLNFQTENTRLDGEKSSLTWTVAELWFLSKWLSVRRAQHAITEYRET